MVPARRDLLPVIFNANLIELAVLKDLLRAPRILISLGVETREYSGSARVFL